MAERIQLKGEKKMLLEARLDAIVDVKNDLLSRLGERE